MSDDAPPKWTMFIVYKDRVIFETHDLEESPQEQDVIDQVVKLAKWDAKNNEFRKQGHFAIDLGHGPVYFAETLGDSLTIHEINNSEHVDAYNKWKLIPHE